MVKASSFIIRHFMASLASVAIPVILASVAYFVLLAYAVATNSDVGGPLALPFLVVASLVVSSIYTAILLFPSVLIAEAISRRLEKWQHVAQIPLSALVLAGLTWLIALGVKSIPMYPDFLILHWADHPLYTFLVLLFPLGVYWWTMKIAQIGVSIPAMLFKRLERSRKTTRHDDPRNGDLQSTA